MDIFCKQTKMSDPLNLAHQAGSYDSEFEYDTDAERRRKKHEDLAKKEKKKITKGNKRELEDEYNKDQGRIMRQQIISMNAYDRHCLLINNYIQYYSGSHDHFKRDTSTDKTDLDVIRENHKFLWTEDDDPEQSWAKSLAKKYYDKLFKEYCIADLSKYRENKVAMRWRIEKEVKQGKGQFICGNKKCTECDNLRSWEVNFAYMEDGQKKNALVKLRLCPDCSYKLNYHHKKKEIKRVKKEKKEAKRDGHHKKHRSATDGDTDEAKIDKSGISEVGGATSDPDRGVAEGGASEQGTNQNSDNIWSGPAKIVEEKSREEEFDEYFEDMFL